MRKTGCLLLLSALAWGCSAPVRKETTEEPVTFDVAPPPPGKELTALQGFALDYRLQLRLPAAAISRALDDQIAACEKLGAARCLAVGLDYRVDPDDAQATRGQVRLLLARAIAHGYRQAVIADAGRRQGGLIAIEARAEDERAAASALAEQIAALEAARSKAAQAKTSPAETARIAQDLAEARQQAATTSQAVALAPMTIDYEAARPAAGFFTSVAEPLKGVRSKLGEITGGTLRFAILALPVLLLAAPLVVGFLWIVIAPLRWLLRRRRQAKSS